MKDEKYYICMCAHVSCSVVSDSLQPMDCQALSMGLSRQKFWSELPFPSPIYIYIYFMFVYIRSGKFYKKLKIVLSVGGELQQWESQVERTLHIISFSNIKF
ncbi:unnamed protein product [Rangifer tarandus platyrhynchus]|uniref:Uncharacterized protein n=2 Tax=Rangifer tarandus platyrhynchus TaxID=3082113 RepID=A0ABN8YFM7_RANTA|nr:unnamed protein product [Rangifer tarandus platyrhynchus]